MRCLTSIPFSQSSLLKHAPKCNWLLTYDKNECTHQAYNLNLKAKMLVWYPSVLIRSRTWTLKRKHWFGTQVTGWTDFMRGCSYRNLTTLSKRNSRLIDVIKQCCHICSTWFLLQSFFVLVIHPSTSHSPVTSAPWPLFAWKCTWLWQTTISNLL